MSHLEPRANAESRDRSRRAGGGPRRETRGEGAGTGTGTVGALVALLAVGLALAPLATLHGQTTSGSIQGTVTDVTTGEAVATTEVTAVNLEMGFEKSTLSGQNGTYRLSGLRPGPYRITFSNAFYQERTRDVNVGVGQSLTLDVELAPEAAEMAEITVTALAAESETETPEVATNVGTEQLDDLPQGNRNFLDFALLAPGVKGEGGSITSGAARDININLFIDGASYKNDILQGGVVGQDASNGNPFPQTAVKEFRVITQQYKAEYEKATSAIISAATKSGTNTWQGEAFNFFTAENYSAKEHFLAERGGTQPEFERWQFGGNIGGPLVEDRLFLFASYEGNYQDELTNVNLGDQVPANLQDYATAPGVEVPDDLSSLEGSFGVPFRSNLFFGKLTYAPGEDHVVDVSVNVRDERHERGFGGRATIQQQEVFQNTVTTATARHQFDITENLVNEAMVSYLHYRFDPEPVSEGVSLNFAPWGLIGPRCCGQDLAQDQITLQNDLTWWVPDWGGSHVFKAGIDVGIAEYDEEKRLFQNPQFTFRTAESAFPEEALLGFGDPEVAATNTKIGVYLQDDWSVSEDLIVNLGLRWDVETNGRNNDWTTPQDVQSALDPFVSDSFADAYFTDDGRSSFYGAVQPRVGFSYRAAEQERGKTVLFGGGGLYYDRTPFDFLLDESYRLQYSILTFRFSEDGTPDEAGNPTIAWQDQYLSRDGLLGLVEQGQAPDPEVFLVQNDLEPPKTFQGSLGLRQTVDDWLFSANYTMVRGFNDFTWYFYHRAAGFNPADVPGFSNILTSTQDVKSWFDAVYLKAQKRFTPESGWGAQLSYTLGWADREVTGGRFGGLCCLDPEEFERHPGNNDERHRIVANAVVALPWDLRFSGIGTFYTHRPYSIFDFSQPRPSGLFPTYCESRPALGECEVGTQNGGRASGFQEARLDLRLQKRFQLGPGYGLTIQADVFDVFDHANFTGFEGNVDAETFGEPFVTDGVTRTFQVGARVDFGR